MARELAGLTQEKLAEKIGVSRTAVVRWEAGETDPTLEHLIRMTEILNVTADYLLGIENGDQMLSVLTNMASTLDRLILHVKGKYDSKEKRENS